MNYIFFKLKSASHFEKLEVDGSRLLVWEVKSQVADRLSMSAKDFDLIVSNFQTGEEYADDHEYVQKNTSLNVERKPLEKASYFKPSWVRERERVERVKEAQEDMAPLLNTAAHISHLTTSATPTNEEERMRQLRMDEDTRYQVTKLQGKGAGRSLMARSTFLQGGGKLGGKGGKGGKGDRGGGGGEGGKGGGDGGKGGGGGDGQQEDRQPVGESRRMQMTMGTGRASRALDKPPPKDQACSLCGTCGHWPSQCPNKERAQKPKRNLVHPRSVPAAMLQVCLATDPDARYQHQDTGVVYKLKPNEEQFKAVKSEFTKQEKVPKEDVPEDLLCLLCNDLFENAVLVSCCGESYCTKCLEAHMEKSDERVCPGCSEHITSDMIVVGKKLRDLCKDFKSKWEAKVRRDRFETELDIQAAAEEEREKERAEKEKEAQVKKAQTSAPQEKREIFDPSLLASMASGAEGPNAAEAAAAAAANEAAAAEEAAAAQRKAQQMQALAEQGMGRSSSYSFSLIPRACVSSCACSKHSPHTFCTSPTQPYLPFAPFPARQQQAAYAPAAPAPDAPTPQMNPQLLALAQSTMLQAQMGGMQMPDPAVLAQLISALQQQQQQPQQPHHHHHHHQHPPPQRRQGFREHREYDDHRRGGGDRRERDRDHDRVSHNRGGGGGGGYHHHHHADDRRDRRDSRRHDDDDRRGRRGDDRHGDRRGDRDDGRSHRRGNDKPAERRAADDSAALAD